jgi:ABC-2 type transport system permease protein
MSVPFGFWLSIVALPLVMAISGLAPVMMMPRSAKPERLAIVDLTGQNLGPAVAKSLVEDQSRAGARALRAAAMSAAGPKAQDEVRKAQEEGGDAAGREVLARYNPAVAARYKAPKAQDDHAAGAPPPRLKAASTARQAGLIARREVDAKRLDSVLILSGQATTLSPWTCGAATSPRRCWRAT